MISMRLAQLMVSSSIPLMFKFNYNFKASINNKNVNISGTFYSTSSRQMYKHGHMPVTLFPIYKQTVFNRRTTIKHEWVFRNESWMAAIVKSFLTKINARDNEVENELPQFIFYDDIVGKNRFIYIRMR